MSSTPRSSRSARQSDARLGADDVGEREAQTFLAHLAAHTETAQRGIDEVGETLLGHVRSSCVTTPARTVWYRTSSKSATPGTARRVVTNT